MIPTRKATKEYLVRRPTMKLDADEKELLESVKRGDNDTLLVLCL